MHLIRSLTALTMVPGIALIAAPPDGTQLKETVCYYNGIGMSTVPNMEETFAMLSVESQKSITPEEWAKKSKGVLPAKSAEVLGREVRNGRTYAVVSVLSPFERGSVTLTQTWVLEEGKWKRLSYLKLKEERDRLFRAGEFDRAWQIGADLLELDPLDPGSWPIILYCRKRQGKEPLNSPKLSDEEIIATAIAINPMDSNTNWLAASSTGDPESAWIYLKRLQGAPNFLPAAANVCNNIEDPRDALAFIKRVEKIEPLNGELLLTKIQALAQSNQWKETAALLQDPSRMASIRETLKGNDPRWTGNWIAAIGLAATAAGRVQDARELLSYGTTLAADKLLTQILSATLEAQDPIREARGAFPPLGPKKGKHSIKKAH